MKQILIALLLAFTTCSLVDAQNQTKIVHDSIGNVKVTVSKKKDANKDANNTAVTVIGIDTEDEDSTEADTTNVNSGNNGFSHGKASITIDADDDDFPFKNLENSIGGGILVAIISIIAVFGLPVFILFVVFFFRYKNRKARYHLVEQALAAGQPLPENFLRENKPTDQRSQGIKNTFTGIGLFIFLWAITGEFGIGTIGLLVMFMGIGQWLIGYKQHQNENTTAPWTHTIHPNENNNRKDVKTESFGTGLTEEKDEEKNGEKNDENR